MRSVSGSGLGGGQISTAGTVSIFYNPTGNNSTVNSAAGRFRLLRGT